MAELEIKDQVAEIAKTFTALRSDVEAIKARDVIDQTKFDKMSKAWVCPPTRSNIDFFRRFRATFTDAAAKFLEDRSEVRRGKLPFTFAFKTKPLDHQFEALQRCIAQDNYALLMDPGTGKSKVMIDDASCYFLEGQCNAALVICPNSIKSNWK
jgi:hypothetical protein